MPSSVFHQWKVRIPSTGMYKYFAKFSAAAEYCEYHGIDTHWIESNN